MKPLMGSTTTTVDAALFPGIDGIWGDDDDGTDLWRLLLLVVLPTTRLVTLDAA